MRPDIKEIRNQIRELDELPQETWADEEITRVDLERLPVGTRSVVYILDMLPPKSRVWGLGLILAAAISLIVLYGVGIL